MRALEGELGVILFQKSGRGIELTEEGSILSRTPGNHAAQTTTHATTFQAAGQSCGTAATVPVYATSYVCNAIFNLLDGELGEHGLDNCTVSECELNEIISAIGRGDQFRPSEHSRRRRCGLDAFPYSRSPRCSPCGLPSRRRKTSRRVAPTTRSRRGNCRTCHLRISTSRCSTSSSNGFSKAQPRVPTIVLHSTNIGRINSLVQEFEGGNIQRHVHPIGERRRGIRWYSSICIHPAGFSGRARKRPH